MNLTEQELITYIERAAQEWEMLYGPISAGRGVYLTRVEPGVYVIRTHAKPGRGFDSDAEAEEYLIDRAVNSAYAHAWRALAIIAMSQHLLNRKGGRLA